jgi:hypothetical protein
MASSTAWRECGLPDNFVIQFDQRQRKKRCCYNGDEGGIPCCFVILRKKLLNNECMNVFLNKQYL